MYLSTLCYGHNIADSGYDGVKQAKRGKSEILSESSVPIVVSRRSNLGFQPNRVLPLALRLSVKILRVRPTFCSLFMNLRSNLRGVRAPTSTRSIRRLYLRLGERIKLFH